MRRKGIAITQLIDKEYLQVLQETFAQVSGITTVIVDPNGIPITTPSNLGGVCSMMFQHEVARSKCMITNNILIEENLMTGKPSIITCPHSGLRTASVPIFVDEMLEGSWIIGQIRIDDPDEQLLQNTASVTQMNSNELINAMRSLPVYSQNRFDLIYEFLISLTSVIVDLAQTGRDLSMRNSQLQTMHSTLKNLAYYDKQMNLPNLLKLTSDCDKLKEDFFIICLDIRQLRRINDAYGHSIGDSLLQSISANIIEETGSLGKVYRTDGDEFCVLLQTSDKKSVEALANKIHSRFDSEWVLSIAQDNVYVNCSACTCVLDGSIKLGDDEGIEDLIRRGMDATCQTSGFLIYDSLLNEKFKQSVKMEVSLKNAIKQGMNGFYLNYQPIVSSVSGKWCGLEVLCRWNSPEFGFVFPDVFIHEAERLGLIESLGHWVLETSVEQCKKWGLDSREDFFLDVNFSSVQIADINLSKKVLDVLEKYSFNAKCLCIEITESTELVLNKHTFASLESLRQKGVKVALDDFGVGYSCFRSLKDIPADTIKTERQFVKDIETDEYLQNLFRIMVELSHVAGKNLIAEGVETKEQLDIVLTHGADFIQGYYYSKPLSVQDLGSRLHEFDSETNGLGE